MEKKLREFITNDVLEILNFKIEKENEIKEEWNEIEKYNSDLEEINKYDNKLKEFININFNDIINNKSKKYLIQLKDNEKEEIAIIFDKYNDIEYIGYLKNDKYEGYGRLYNNNSLKYQGFFNDGKYNGIGILYDNKYDYKDIYIGYFKNEKYNGYGKLLKNNKLVYQGYFYENKYEGKGCLYFENKKIYKMDYLKMII